MKLIFAHYLASLKERGELDVIIPDLLSELGVTVLSRPALGTKQYGVDVAAVGTIGTSERSLYLLSIKPGDLKRSTWDTGPQSMRASLNQVVDVYIQKHIPKRYSDLPIVVVLCLGGELHEAVRLDVDGYMDHQSTERITFDVWNGDRLADLLLTGVLRENALPETWRASFRKAVALVDEPDVCFTHFRQFLDDIRRACRPTRSARLTAARQIHVALWTLYVWAREAGNIETPYLCSERAMLFCWEISKESTLGKSTESRRLRDLVERVITVHSQIAYEFETNCITPRADLRHGLAGAVPSQAALDINLKLFDTVGRLASHGLWKWHACVNLLTGGDTEEAESVGAELHTQAELLMKVIGNNPALCTPIKDNQAIDIDICCLFLNSVGYTEFVRQWVQQIAGATMFAYKVNSTYACIFTEYRDLADHPVEGSAYRERATAGSILVPTLAAWAAITGDVGTLDALADFASGPYKHSTLQLLFPGPDTEEHVYCGSGDHGVALIEMRIERSCAKMLAVIESECARLAEFRALSAVRRDFWPMVISASRHHRVPVPPHFWLMGRVASGAS